MALDADRKSNEGSRAGDLASGYSMDLLTPHAVAIPAKRHTAVQFQLMPPIATEAPALKRG